MKVRTNYNNATGPYLLRLHVESLVLEDDERVHVLLGQNVVHGHQALTQLHVQATVVEATHQQLLRGTLVAQLDHLLILHGILVQIPQRPLVIHRDRQANHC